ncbi:MAG: 4Fe-4S binding protein, partial [Spirochaetaceae bacterium]
LAIVLVQTIRSVALVSATLNPSRAMFHVWFGGALPGGLAALALILVGSLFVERPWCRWVCPFGAVQGTLSLAAPWTIRRSATDCPGCRRCTRACPMGIDVHTPTAVRDTRCVRCMECVDACRVDGALTYSARRNTHTGGRSPASDIAARGIAARGIAAAALVLFFAPVVIARATGAYLPPRIAATAPVTLAVEDVSPTMTVDAVAEGFAMTTGELLALLEMDPDFDGATRLFDIEDDERYEHITVAHVRSVLAESAVGE